MAKKTKASKDSTVVDALEQFEASQTGSEFNRKAYYDDVNFSRMSQQWPDSIKKQRIQEGRPALVINKLPALIRSVVNESRQNKPAIKISPVDSGADEETAEVIGGLIRSIERGSSAEVAYNKAIDDAITGGFGFWRIAIDYSHDDSFSLEARIERIPNPLSVHWDVSSTRFDAKDWRYAFVSEMVKKDEYERKYPDGSMTPFDGDNRSSSEELWMDDDSIRVAEYFRKDVSTRNLLQLAVMNPQTGKTDLQVVREDELPDMARKFFGAGGIKIDGMSDDELIRGFMEAAGVEERRRRTVEFDNIKRFIINGVEVLEEDDWPGSLMPICPVWGDEVFIDGRRHFRSMIRDAKDPQIMFNFWRSATTELVALAPRAPFIGPKGFVPKGEETKWATANTRSHAYLEYNAEAGPPTRQMFAGVPAGALQESMNANDDMKAITGIFDSSIGARSNETSGKAILARERQGDVSNYHFLDNLSRAIRWCGEILVDIIPAIYSPLETVRILGEDQTTNVVNLSQNAASGYTKGVDGQPELYNLGVGKYDVTVSTGPTFATEREQTRETLIEIMRNVPAAAPFIGDVLLDHMDFVGADKISKRLKFLLPPEVRKAEEAEGNEDNPEAAMLQQQLQAFQQEAEQMKQQVGQEMQRLNSENEQMKGDNQAANFKANAEIQLKDRELKLKEAELELKIAEPRDDQEKTWQYERTMAHDKMDFEASENAKDRQVDLAKTIIAKSDPESDDDSVMEDVAETALAVALEKLNA